MNTEDRTEGNGKGGLYTYDEFMAAVPWGTSRMVLVHRRTHGWRQFIRLRTWNRHYVKQVWYPSRRFFVVPIQDAAPLAAAIVAAAQGESSPKPDWLIAREAAEDDQLTMLRRSGAPPETVSDMKEHLAKDRRSRI